MMIRTQIQIDEAQIATIKKIASLKKMSMSKLIREGMNFYLQNQGVESQEEKKKRAMAAAGRFRSGSHNLSKKHDAYLAEAYSS